jgi:geranylgeranyl pyrophosphate synthase
MLLAEVFGYHRQYVYDIIDDIEDNSTVRRNKECVHLLYGVDISVNAGNLVYFAPMMRLFRSGKYKSEQLNHMATIYL